MSREVVLIGKRGDCIRVPNADIPKYAEEGYRPWNGPVPGPGQETVHDIPGGSALLAAERLELSKLVEPTAAATEALKDVGIGAPGDGPVKPVKKKPKPKEGDDGTE